MSIRTELSCSLNESGLHYLIYKIVNNVNGKYYIGQHVTSDVFDAYEGSGKILNRAESKYGLSVFTKIILFDFDNFQEMNDKERELVQLSNCYPYDPMSYNLREGGSNGSLSKSTRQKIAEKRTGQSLTDDHKMKISNGLSGMIWINNGSESKFVQPDNIPDGWIFGRIVSSKMKKHNTMNSKDVKWINNGIQEMRIKSYQPLPDGYTYGMLPVSDALCEKRRKNMIGKISVTNGKINKFVRPDSIPDGFYPRKIVRKRKRKV